MTRARFEQLVPSDPHDPAGSATNSDIAVIVEDEPPDALLDEMEIDPPTRSSASTRAPAHERAWITAIRSRRIVLYQGPIEDASETEDDIV